MYGVQSVGIESGFGAAGKQYQAADAGVCAGSDSFTVFLAVQVLLPAHNQSVIAGTRNALNTGGWYIRRNDDAIGTQVEFEISAWLGAPTALVLSANAPSILGRTMLLALDVEEGFLTLYVNGAIVSFVGGVGAYVPSPTFFGLGNIAGLGVLGMPDRLIGLAYAAEAASSDQHAQIWNAYRETSSLRYAGDTVLEGFANVYDASEIAAPPVRFRPQTWPNEGTTAPAGDLTWINDIADEDEVRFSVDSDPDYTMVDSQIFA